MHRWIMPSTIICRTWERVQMAKLSQLQNKTIDRKQPDRTQSNPEGKHKWQALRCLKSLMTDLSIGCTGSSDEAGIISKGPCINAHLYIIKLWVEQHKRVGSGKYDNNGQKQYTGDMILACVNVTSWLYVYSVVSDQSYNKTSYFLKKCPLTSNCCLSMTFPRYSMISMSSSRLLAARRIFLCFCTRVTRPNWSYEHEIKKLFICNWGKIFNMLY